MEPVDLHELKVLVRMADTWLDDNVSQEYKDQPLAQDWARVCKGVEELGEGVTELIGFTGQNPRKGVTSTQEKMLNEMADTALTMFYGIQHFTKDIEVTFDIFMDKARYHRVRIGY